MRTIPIPLKTAVAKSTLTLANLVRITRQDGVVLRLCDSVFNVVIGSGASIEVYRADVGMTVSSTMIGLNLANAAGFTMSIAMGDGGVMRSDIRARRFYGATVELFEVDWTQPNETMMLRSAGIVGRTSWTQSGVAQMEVQPSNSDVLIADEVYSQTCRASLGDSKCAFPIEDFRVDFTVTGVTDDQTFTVDTFGPTAAATPADDYFGQGQLKWVTGQNAEWATDVLSGDFNTKTIVLFLPLPSPIVIGDTGKVYPGCDRQFSTCIAKFANWLNFRGEPLAPQGSLGL